MKHIHESQVSRCLCIFTLFHVASVLSTRIEHFALWRAYLEQLVNVSLHTFSVLVYSGSHENSSVNRHQVLKMFRRPNKNISSACLLLVYLSCVCAHIMSTHVQAQTHTHINHWDTPSSHLIHYCRFPISLCSPGIWVKHLDSLITEFASFGYCALAWGLFLKTSGQRYFSSLIWNTKSPGKQPKNRRSCDWQGPSVGSLLE